MKKKLMGKRLLGLGMTIVCIAGAMIVPTYAADNISVTYNGGYIQFTESMGSPYVESNRVLVPLRAVSEGMNKKVDWNAATRQVTVSDNTSNVKLTIGNKVVSVNGVNQTTDVPAIVNNNRTYVPLRFISECMGATVDWNGQNKLVSITDKTGNKPIVDPNGFVGVGNMVAGQTYKLDQLVTNRVQQYELLKLIVTDDNYLDTSTITVKKGTWGNSVSGITIKAFGWSNANKIAGAFEYTGTATYDAAVIFFKGNEILRVENCFINEVVNGKQYFLFGDGLNYTDKDMADATHIGFAIPYAGEILVIQKPNPVINLSVHGK